MGINEQNLKYLWIKILRSFLPIAKLFYVFCCVKAYDISGKQPLGERRSEGVIYKKNEQMCQCLISLLLRQEGTTEMHQPQQTCENISKIVKYSLELFDALRYLGSRTVDSL